MTEMMIKGDGKMMMEDGRDDEGWLVKGKMGR